ncbi:MAG: hypothetical protein ACP5OZ_01155 [Candidatus Woesearchaeota archaeon]
MKKIKNEAKNINNRLISDFQSSETKTEKENKEQGIEFEHLE